MSELRTRETEQLAVLAGEVESLREALDAAMLELSLEDREWRRLMAGSRQEFSKSGIDRIAEISRLMAIKNPLIKRGLAVQAAYTFGQGVTIAARHALLRPVVQAFVDRNRDALFGLQAQLLRDRELACDGNLFLALFTNPVTGAVKVRSIPLDQITDIICDPEDQASPWYYRRNWTERAVDGQVQTRTAYYPDWRYRPQTRPQMISDSPVLWESPIYHVAVGAFTDWTWGLSEVYAAIDWARAYKEFLEDWATITRALSRFAWKRATRGTARAVQAAKRQMATTLGSGAQGETNPPATVGAVAIMGEGEDLEPMRTAGATTKMEDGRRLLLMIAAAQNLPETFYGDASVGSLATAKSLDRPTELAMAERQQLWREVYADLCEYQLRETMRVAVRRLAPADLKPLAALGRVARIDEQAEAVRWAIDPATEKPIDPSIDQSWPPIVEIDPLAEVQTVMAAAPKLPDERLIARLLLQALRVADVDDVLAALFPADLAPSVPRDPTTKEEPV